MNKELDALFDSYEGNLLNYFSDLTPEQSRTLNETIRRQKQSQYCYKPHRTLNNYGYYGLHNWPPNGYRSMCLCILPRFIQSAPITRPVHKVSTISPIVGIFCYYIRVRGLS